MTGPEAADTAAPSALRRAQPPGVPELPKVEMALCPPKQPGVGVVVSSQICTASRKSAGFVRHVSIDVSGTPMAGHFRPGQSFGILAPGTDERGRPHAQRLYSIASPTRGERAEGKRPGDVIATTVKRTIDEHWETHRLFLGVASNYLCDLQVGDEVRITGPHGKRFLLPAVPQNHDYVFFATGTGIAPFRGMIYDLLEQGPSHSPDSRIWLVMGSPYATDLLYHDEFLRLAEEHPNFRYLTALSREHQTDAHTKMYVQDRLETHRDEIAPLLSSERALLYICGVAGMEIGIFQKLGLLLSPPALEQYLTVDPTIAEDVLRWDRSMLNKQVRPTRRVFLEVY